MQGLTRRVGYTFIEVFLCKINEVLPYKGQYGLKITKNFIDSILKMHVLLNSVNLLNLKIIFRILSPNNETHFVQHDPISTI